MEKTNDWAALLSAANRGDTVAYAAFLRAAAPVVRGIVRARAHALDPSACEDIVQDVMLAIHLKRATWDADRPVRPWLYAITRHKIIDALRRNGRDATVPIEDHQDTLPAETQADPFQARDVERTIARLDPRSQDILRSLAFKGQSLHEIGLRFGLTEGATRVALHRALRKIADLHKGDRT
jgi:RNA polymerase sigma factor (sigma-70 family)